MTIAVGLVVAGGSIGGPRPARAEEPKRMALMGEENGTAPGAEYRIGAGDVLQIFAWKNDTLSRTVAVRPDGRISFPPAGRRPPGRHDAPRAPGHLTRKLAEFVAALEVSVIGEVPKPGRFELKSRTVLDVLAMGGGFGPFASRSGSVILRPEGEGMKRIPFNYNRTVSPGGEQEDLFMQAGDIAVVPWAAVANESPAPRRVGRGWSC